MIPRCYSERYPVGIGPRTIRITCHPNGHNVGIDLGPIQYAMSQLEKLSSWRCRVGIGP